MFLILLVISSCVIAGCVSSHDAEFTQANSLIESANSRFLSLNPVNMTTVQVGEIRANASAAQRDLAEAKKILEKIPPNELKTQDRADLKALILMLNGTIELTEVMEGPLADLIEDAQIIINSKDPATVSDAGLKFKQDLAVLKIRVNKINNEFSSINDTGLSPKIKQNISQTKTSIKSLSADIDNASARLADACLKICSDNEILGTDCQCHPRCGYSYCARDAVCRNNICYRSPVFT